MPSTFDPAGFAQRQLDAYNAHDLERFVAEYTEDVEVFVLPDPKPVSVGKAALAAHYRDNRFNLPELHAKLVNRMVFGNKVIDQEVVYWRARCSVGRRRDLRSHPQRNFEGLVRPSDLKREPKLPLTARDWAGGATAGPRSPMTALRGMKA